MSTHGQNQQILTDAIKELRQLAVWRDGEQIEVICDRLASLDLLPDAPKEAELTEEELDRCPAVEDTARWIATEASRKASAYWKEQAVKEVLDNPAKYGLEKVQK